MGIYLVTMNIMLRRPEVPGYKYLVTMNIMLRRPKVPGYIFSYNEHYVKETQSAWVHI